MTIFVLRQSLLSSVHLKFIEIVHGLIEKSLRIDSELIERVQRLTLGRLADFIGKIREREGLKWVWSGDPLMDE